VRWTPKRIGRRELHVTLGIAQHVARALLEHGIDAVRVDGSRIDADDTDRD